MFPEIAHRISSSLGSGFCSRSAAATSIIPGVQKPHCSPCSSLKARCSTCDAPSELSPSTVVTAWPSAWTASRVHDFTGVPSRSTVHAPQCVVSHPMCVPVSSTVLRTKSTSSRRGSTWCRCSVPLTETLISTVSSLGCPCFLGGGRERPAREHPHDVSLPFGRAAYVRPRFRCLRRQLPGFREQLVPGSLAHEQLLGLDDLRVDRRDSGERDSG